MAEESNLQDPNATVKEAPPALGRFRLPKLFAEPGDAANASNGDAPGDDASNGAATNGHAVNGMAGGVAAGGGGGGGGVPDAASNPAAPGGALPKLAQNGGAAPNGQPPSPALLLLNEMGLLRDGMELMYRTICDMSDRESSREKIFDTLYSEMRDYKNDFIYEHLKPIVRPLLFLHDSLEQFDSEVQTMILPPEAERRQLSPTMVRQNVTYFADQLVEALRICEVTQMENVEGPFNPKLHKAVEVQEVEAERDNTIVRVVRKGWYLNGQLLRPAEVVVGKSKN